MTTTRQSYTWSLPRGGLALGRRTAVMGVLNVTPDSFSDGGFYLDRQRAIARALELEQDGADLVDIGGESSRPGSLPVSGEEELARVLPVVEALAGKLGIPISIDTYRSGVARRALEAGARIVNDISAGRFDPELTEVVRSAGAGVILMHSRGSRDNMHRQPPMPDATITVYGELAEAAERALGAGISRAAIVLDPGIGFGKTNSESVAVLRNLDAFSKLEYPLAIGVSRKPFIRGIDRNSPEKKLWSTAAAVAAAIIQGAHIVRVHDVPQMRTVADVIDAIVNCDDSGVE